MRRKVFDVLVSAGGLLVVAVLVVAGALLMWAQSFTNSSVHNQLAQQDIFFPAKADITPAQRPYLLQYAGQQVLTGAQANSYAQKIASDVAGMPYGGVYAKISAAALANPNSAALKAEAQTAFEGTTLRACCSKPMPSAPSGRSRFGPGSPPSSLPASCSSSSRSGSGTREESPMTWRSWPPLRHSGIQRAQPTTDFARAITLAMVEAAPFGLKAVPRLTKVTKTSAEPCT